MTEDVNPLGLCMCGCGQSVGVVEKTNTANGQVMGHHFRYVRGHACKGRTLGRRTEHAPANPSGLCMCGCGEPTEPARCTDARIGNVEGLPQRYVKGHNRRKNPVAFVIDETTGCWVWQRCLNAYGYGQMRVGGKAWLAHRYYYEQTCGPIPDGLELDHLCRNRACVNPDHLEPVTRSVNTLRGARCRPELRLLEESVPAT